jgi:hypothetical protein
MSAITIALAIIHATAWLLPDPADKFGWGLRVRLDKPHPPLLPHEIIWWGRLKVMLINRTSETREYVPRDDGVAAGDLNVVIAGPDGREPPGKDYRGVLPDLRKGRCKVPATGILVSEFAPKEFGYMQFHEPGVYEMRATLRVAEGLLFTPALKFRVIEPAVDAIVAKHNVPPDGDLAEKPAGRRQRVMIQQIQVEGRTRLYYLMFEWPEYGGKARHAYRLAELPDKVHMKVEGSYGEGGPLKITYQVSPTAKPTNLVVHSIGGRPWTEKDEKSWQERLREKGGLPPVAPPPRVKRR